MYGRFLGLLCVIVLVSGCATKGKFVYEPSPRPAENAKGKLVAALAPLADTRERKHQFNSYYDGDPIKDLQAILENELLGTKLFNKVITVSERNLDVTADVMIEPTLQDLEWNVPDYDALLTKMFIVSFLTGGIGGAIYGSTDIDVHGKATIAIRVTDKVKGTVLIDKSYDGHYDEQIATMQCDLPQTKVKMANESLKKTIALINSDLKIVLGTSAPAMVTSQTPH